MAKRKRKSSSDRGLPFRHRTQKGRPILFARAPDGRDDPEIWLRLAVAKNLEKLEERMGTTILRENRTVNPPLGCGAYGCVFQLADGRVLKVTSDEAEGPLTYWIMGLQKKSQRIKGFHIIEMTTKIDDVFVFPNKIHMYGENSPVYGIVREEVDPPKVNIPDKLMDAVDFYTDGWDGYCQTEERGGRVIGVSIARLGLKKIRRAGREGKAMASLLEYCWDLGIPLMDVHGQNLARRITAGRSKYRKPGQIVIFDFGGTERCSMGPVVKKSAPDKIRVRRLPTFKELAREIPKL